MSQRPTSVAMPTLKQISWRAVHDPRLASTLREIWGIPQCDAAFAVLTDQLTPCSTSTSSNFDPELDSLRSAALPTCCAG